MTFSDGTCTVTEPKRQTFKADEWVTLTPSGLTKNPRLRHRIGRVTHVGDFVYVLFGGDGLFRFAHDDLQLH